MKKTERICSTRIRTGYDRLRVAKVQDIYRKPDIRSSIYFNYTTLFTVFIRVVSFLVCTQRRRGGDYIFIKLFFFEELYKDTIETDLIGFPLLDDFTPQYT